MQPHSTSHFARRWHPYHPMDVPSFVPNAFWLQRMVCRCRLDGEARARDVPLVIVRMWY